MKSYSTKLLILSGLLLSQFSWGVAVDCSENADMLGVAGVTGCAGGENKDLGTLYKRLAKSANTFGNYENMNANQKSYKPDALYSGENFHCSIFKVSAENCEEEVAPGNELYSFMHDSITAISRYGWSTVGGRDVDPESELSQKCACIETNFYVSSPGVKTESITNYINTQKEKASEKVLKAYGKKFLNEYSLFYEDMIYLVNQTKVIQGKSKESLFCRGAEQIQKEISKKCPGVNSGQIEKRMGLLFEGIKGVEKNSDLDAVLSFVDASTVQRKVTDGNGSEVIYARTEFDKSRFGLTLSPEFRFVDSVLTEVIFNDEQFRERFMYRPSQGLESVAEYLAEQFKNNFDETLVKLSRNGRPTQAIIDELNALKAQSKDAIGEKLKKHLLDSVAIHPGLSAILLEPGLLQQTLRATRGKKSNSLMESLQNNFSFLEDHMKERCDNMVSQFAQVACLPPEDVLAHLPKSSLKQLLEEQENFVPNQNINDLINCASGEKEFSPFENLSQNGSSVVQSDFLAILDGNKKPQDSFSLFAQSLANKDQEGDLIAKAANVYYQRGGRESVYEPLSKYVGNRENKLIDSNGNTMTIAQREAAKVAERYREQGTESLQGSHISQVPAAKAPMSSSFSDFRVRETSASNNSSAKAVSEFLSKREDKKEIDQHISRVDNSELKKLQEFKESVLADKEARLLKELDDEKKSLSELRSQIDKLTSGKNNVVGHTQRQQQQPRQMGSRIEDDRVAVDQRVQFAPSQNSEASPSRTYDRAPASVAFSTGGSAMGASAMGRSYASSASSVAAQKTPAGLQLQDEKNVFKDSKELSDKIVDYLKNADGETFLKFTKEGVVYKYKVVENGVEVEKEVYVSLSDLDNNLIKEIIKNSEEKISLLERKYSFNSLKMIITEEVTSKQ